MIASRTHALDQAGPAESTPALVAQGLTLDYASLRALDDVSFVVETGAILCLLGASGSGKSSVLRLVAGLERPTAGEIRLAGAVVTGCDTFVEPERRRVGMVFQDFALFPHLTVRANVAFGIRRLPAAEIDARVGQLLEDVGLAQRAASYPHMLSGGERQRIALARALAPRPRILLMDEPFSSLDSRLRDHVREQTMELLRAGGTTTIMVTHDASEALRVADRIGVLSHGRLVQFGRPVDLYRRPCSPQLAASFGTVNTMDAAVEGGTVRTPLGDFPAPADAAAGPAVVCIRPEHVRLSADGMGARAVVTGVTWVGDVTEVRLRAEDLHLIARVPDAALLAPGDDRRITVEPSQMFVFPRRDAGVRRFQQ